MPTLGSNNVFLDMAGGLLIALGVLSCNGQTSPTLAIATDAQDVGAMVESDGLVHLHGPAVVRYPMKPGMVEVGRFHLVGTHSEKMIVRGLNTKILPGCHFALHGHVLPGQQVNEESAEFDPTTCEWIVSISRGGSDGGVIDVPTGSSHASVVVPSCDDDPTNENCIPTCDEDPNNPFCTGGGSTDTYTTGDAFSVGNWGPLFGTLASTRSYINYTLHNGCPTSLGGYSTPATPGAWGASITLENYQSDVAGPFYCFGIVQGWGSWHEADFLCDDTYLDVQNDIQVDDVNGVSYDWDAEDDGGCANIMSWGHHSGPGNGTGWIMEGAPSRTAKTILGVPSYGGARTIKDRNGKSFTQVVTPALSQLRRATRAWPAGN